jgi:hypothetical protein
MTQTRRGFLRLLAGLPLLAVVPALPKPKPKPKPPDPFRYYEGAPRLALWKRGEPIPSTEEPARFGVTSGNVMTEDHVWTETSFKDAMAEAIERFRQFKDTKGEPYFEA